MREVSKGNVGRVIGIDLGDRVSHVCELDARGEVVSRSRVATTRAAMQKLLGGRPRCRVAIEAGTHSPWVSRGLEEWGHEVVVANPRRVRLIGESRRKDDRTDAETLARLVRVDPKLLGPVRHRSAEAQAVLALIKARDVAVRSRTTLILHCRGMVKTTGQRLPTGSAESFVAQAGPAIPESLHAALAPVLPVIVSLSAAIAGYDAELERVAAERCPQAALLTAIPGVGSLTALAFLTTLGDPQRFPSSRSVGAFLGLVPGRRESGDSRPRQRISKEGNGLMRRLLVQCAHRLLGPFGAESDLRRFGERLAARGGRAPKRRAVVAVARKLAVLMHSLWRHGALYDPDFTARHRTT
jgi:transposase